jgi:capping protein beta
MADKLDCALDLMRRLPPAQVEDNLVGLLDLVPDLTEQLLSAVDQPLKIAHDPISKRDYLLCDYNRDGDSFRYFEFLQCVIFFQLHTDPPGPTSMIPP